MPVNTISAIKGSFFRVTALLFIAIILSSCNQKENWSQFRGPGGSMTIGSVTLPEEWSSETNVIWTSALEGKGYSSPVIWGNKVFITSAVGEKVNPVPERPPMGGQQPPQGNPQGQTPGQGQAPAGSQGQRPAGSPQPGQQGQPPRQDMPEVRDTSFMRELYRLEVICLDLGSGNILWKKVAYSGTPRAAKNPNNTYACETPATDGERVIASFGMNGLFCFDMDGNLLWQKDQGPYYTQRGWGTGSSPVLYNGQVIVQCDNEENSFIISYDINTGEEKWSTVREEKTTYSTPYIWKNNKRTELVTCGKTARSYDPVTGDLLWELNIGGDQVIPSPIGNEEFLYIGNTGGRETKPVLLAVKAGGNGKLTDSEIAWKSEDSGLGNPSPLLHNGLLYIIGSRGEIAVIDPVNGAVRYQKRISGIGACWASPWAYKDRIYFLDENGMTRSFAASEPFEMAGENKLDGKFWSTPAIADGKYVFKGTENIYCIGE